MNFSETWGLLLVEGSILASVFILLLFVKKTLKLIPPKRVKALSSGKKILETNLEKINQLLKESESLSLDLSNNLTEKREIVKKLVETLDEKIRALSQLLERIESKIPASTPGTNGKDGNNQIIEMAMAGCGVDDIARRLGLSKEEVQLILDLRKITTN
ncbi:MAG: DUF2802 domain-containing protein [Thermodesulfobacteriota bacterium]|jgi:DNA-binding transcriptional MerR regulator